ncbi:bifunctional NAD(P)/FAD-dependent oxidoreductase/class I SAM-dependent methyltransferase [Actinomadura flavalba]|uniref:bifunctional NAD(P)/FAD-dependent oxidoreductase/class I SAM-dependent methyltransferase n=1 Tax=Actinomadura flavalba TaxID=1120938 RepID=UPI00036194E8|nr:bifunctional NAD(P)/FAD-dependent oxidoreductase/class I SAM-dependent methyltransferase [Actinomadura flavalba]
MTFYDVIVIGGGAAGLSGATALGRARRSVLVVDAGRPRNAPSAHLHGFLGRDGASPAELLATGREEVRRYGGEIAEASVTSAEPVGAAFRVGLDDGTFHRSRRLLLATGVTDELPDVAGVAGRWGRDVLHCPYCHGWEVRDRRIGVLATGPMGLHQALLWRQWTPDVTLFLHTCEQPGADEMEKVLARGITVVDGTAAALEVDADRLTGVRMADGRSVACDALVVGPRPQADLALAASLGLEVTESERNGIVLGNHVKVDAAGATSVRGVWAAGNVTDLTAQVAPSAAAGMLAGAAINADLIEEETRRAVESRTAEGYWDGLYRERDRIWSGDPNASLVAEVCDLKPGTALDLGSGEGGDAIWLAGQGWRVTGVDVSPLALARAADHADSAGVADRVEWRHCDLEEDFPGGSFDLVTASFLHSPLGLESRRVLRAAADAVAPSGTLLIIGHAPGDHGAAHTHADLPTPEQIITHLNPDPATWRVERAETVAREGSDRPDTIVKLTRTT